ncbi:MAG TPA: mechanosensitive ion channel family protein [Planctomycetota bacterium]|nr:mechanosensitive ion channel family protein [Planctomycetota bacterium]
MTSMFLKFRRCLRAQFGLALFVVLPLWASLGTAGAAHASSQGETAQTAAPAAEYASPRETLRTFLREISAWRRNKRAHELEAAVRALDLGGIPSAERSYNGQRFATQLVNLLDKIGMVDPEELPSAGPNSGGFAKVLSRVGAPEVSIELEFRRAEGGEWLISQGTLARLQGWTEKYESIAPLVGTGSRVTPQEWLHSVIPGPLSKRVLFLEAWQWIGLLVLVLVGILAQRIVSFFFARFVAHVSSSDRLAVDSKLLARVARPVALLATSIAFFMGVPLLDLDPHAYHFVNILANVGLTIALVWTAYRLVDVLSWVMAQKASQTDTKFDDMLVPLVRRTLKFVVVILGVILMITRLDSDLWGLVAGLSIGSLAVGFAAKDSIENLFGTFTVLMDKPFQLGDLILVNGVEGTVEDVGFRSTRLRTAEDSLITVPNSRFIAASVENRGLRRFKRVRTVLGLTYDTPPEKIEAFCEGIRELIRRHPYTRKSDYHIWLSSFSASSLDVQLTLFFEVPDWATESRERHRLYLDILRLAERVGVSFAFPTQTVQWERAPARSASGGKPAGGSPLDLGRRVASEVAAESLRYPPGKRPPPIRFDTQDADDAGHGRLP